MGERGHPLLGFARRARFSNENFRLPSRTLPMKSLRIHLLTVSSAALILAVPSRAPAQEAAPSPPPGVETEVTLIPEPVKEEKKKPEEPEKSEKTEKSKTAVNAEELLERVHYRQAYTKAQRDPKVAAEWERASKARTDLEKREALKTYYTLLHARIVKLDASLKKTSDLRRGVSLRRLQQTRIDATEPLDPQERAERFNSANE